MVTGHTFNPKHLDIKVRACRKTTQMGQGKTTHGPGKSPPPHLVKRPACGWACVDRGQHPSAFLASRCAHPSASLTGAIWNSEKWHSRAQRAAVAWHRHPSPAGVKLVNLSPCFTAGDTLTWQMTRTRHGPHTKGAESGPGVWPSSTGPLPTLSDFFLLSLASFPTSSAI